MQALSATNVTKKRKKEKGQKSGRGEGAERNTVEEEDASLKMVQEEEGVNMSRVSNYSQDKEELVEEVEASTVVNYSKEEVKELLLKKKTSEVEVGRVILVNYRPAVLKKRKVKVGKSEERWSYTNRRRKPNISKV